MMEELMFKSSGEVLIASCVAAWAFYLLALVLELPVVWNAVREWIGHFSKLPKKDLESLVSGIHIRVVGGVTLALIALMDPLLWKDTWHGVTPLTQTTLVISTGFFLWDMAVSIRRASTDGPEFIMHGSLCFAFYLYTVLSNNFHYFGCGFLLWEMSTPFVHFRWFLAKTNKKDTLLYIATGLFMMLVFCGCRICWGAYLGVKFFASSLQPQEAVSPITIWLLRGIWLALNGLNWYWFRLMLLHAIRVILKQSSHRESPKARQNDVKLKS